MGGKSPGPSLEVCKAGMAEVLVVKGVSSAGGSSWDAIPWGLERLGKEEWSPVGSTVSQSRRKPDVSNLEQVEGIKEQG